MTSADQDGGAGLEGPGDLIAMTPDAVALARVPSFFERDVNPSDVNEMLSVECANGAKRRSAVGLDEAVLPGPIQ